MMMGSWEKTEFVSWFLPLPNFSSLVSKPWTWEENVALGLLPPWDSWIPKSQFLCATWFKEESASQTWQGRFFPLLPWLLSETHCESIHLHWYAWLLGAGSQAGKNSHSGVGQQRWLRSGGKLERLSRNPKRGISKLGRAPRVHTISRQVLTHCGGYVMAPRQIGKLKACHLNDYSPSVSRKKLEQFFFHWNLIPLQFGE